MQLMNEELAKVSFLVDAENSHTETLWARPVESDTFELLNTPFYAYDCALRDIVRCDTTRQPARFVEVVTPSGNRTARVEVAETPRMSIVKRAVFDRLVALGCTCEVLSHDSGLIAVSIPPACDELAVVAFLEELVRRGDAEWEAANFTVEA